MDEVFQAAAGAMVYFEGVLDDGRPGAGAGFHVGGGRIVTAAHVVQDLVTYQIWWDDPSTPENESVEVSFAEPTADEDHDLAVLATDFTGAHLEIVPATERQPQPQQDVLILGYPRLALTKGPVLCTAKDHIAAVVPASRDIYGVSSLVLSRAHPPGYSGGPALLASGKVGGVVSVGRVVDYAVEYTSCVACVHLRELLARAPPVGGSAQSRELAPSRAGGRKHYG